MHLTKEILLRFVAVPAILEELLPSYIVKNSLAISKDRMEFLFFFWLSKLLFLFSQVLSLMFSRGVFSYRMQGSYRILMRDRMFLWDYRLITYGFVE